MARSKSSSEDVIPETPIMGIDHNLEEIARALRRLTKTKDRVSYLLLNFPETRNSDGLLESLYFGLLYNIPCFLELTPRELRIIDSTDTVRRMRQKLQEEDFSTYGSTDPEVIKKRRLKRRALEASLREG